MKDMVMDLDMIHRVNMESNIRMEIRHDHYGKLGQKVGCGNGRAGVYTVYF